MVGNVSEWVADWIQGNTDPWSPAVSPNNRSSLTYGQDRMTGINPAEFQGGGARLPAALIRGGDFRGTTGSGVFSVLALDAPSFSFDGVGFRCGR